MNSMGMLDSRGTEMGAGWLNQGWVEWSVASTSGQNTWGDSGGEKSESHRRLAELEGDNEMVSLTGEIKRAWHIARPVGQKAVVRPWDRAGLERRVWTPAAWVCVPWKSWASVSIIQGAQVLQEESPETVNPMEVSNLKRKCVHPREDGDEWVSWRGQLSSSVAAITLMGAMWEDVRGWAGWMVRALSGTELRSSVAVHHFGYAGLPFSLWTE